MGGWVSGWVGGRTIAVSNRKRGRRRHITHPIYFDPPITTVRSYVSNKARRMRASAKCKASASAREWLLTESMVRVVTIIYMLTEGVPDPGVVFLKQQGLVHHWSAKTDDELEAIVVNAFIVADRDDITALCDMDTPRDAASLATAVRFVEEWRVVAWSVTSNRKGVTPLTSSTLDHFEQRRMELPELVRPDPWGTTASGVSRKKATRWRKRWGGRFARLSTREVVPVADMRQKAYLHYPITNITTTPHPSLPSRPQAVLFHNDTPLFVGPPRRSQRGNGRTSGDVRSPSGSEHSA